MLKSSSEVMSEEPHFPARQRPVDNSDGGENARKSRKRFHWNQEIASKLHRLPNYSRKSIPGIRRWNQRFININLQNCLQEISWVTDARKKNIFFTACIPSSPFSRSNIKCDYSNVSHYLNINSLGALHADKHVYSIGWHTCLLGEPTSKSK